jgi:hypothetical protein
VARPSSASALLGLALTIGACGSALPPGDADPSAAQADSARPTLDHPEAGYLGNAPSPIIGCSGTLIDPRVVLTAGHCLVAPFAEHNRGFVVQRRATETDLDASVQSFRGTYYYPADDKHFFVPEEQIASGEIGEDDLALLHLSSAVPEAVAQPAALVRSEEEWPSIGDRVLAWGYGCLNVAGESGFSARKEAKAWHWSLDVSVKACKGDSGAGVRLVDGGIFAVMSAARFGGRYTIFANVPKHINAIDAQIASWREADAAAPLP